MRSARAPQTTMIDAIGAMRSDYDAAKQTRYRRRRSVPSMGAGADFHFRSGADFLRIMESARDMDRNDAIVGQTVDRAVINTMQQGFQYDPQTGDDDIDALLTGRWRAWSTDPELCDVAGELTFAAMESLAFRQMLVDGDHIVLPTRDCRLQMVEAHRCRTPRNTKRNVVHGVLLDDARRRLEYWLTKADVDPQRSLIKVSDTAPYATRDVDGHRQLFHIYNPKRSSQTRGVSALAPIFNHLAMFEDIEFAKLVQQQVVSCFAVFRERTSEFSLTQGNDAAQMGAQTTQTLADGSNRAIEGIGPGMQVTGLPGEKLTGFSPNVPNTEYFSHVKQILTVIGINLGLPLILVTMDASQTNFSGWRGAFDQAKFGFRKNQRALRSALHEPLVRFLIRKWMGQDKELLRAHRGGVDVFKHRWNLPSWPYIEPKKDAEADKLRLAANLISPRRLAAERSMDYPELVTEIVADRALLVTTAIETAAQINTENPDARVDWRELAGYDPKGRKADPANRVMEDISRAVRSGVEVSVGEARVALGLPPEPAVGANLLRFNDQDVLQYHIETGNVTKNEVRQRLKLPPVSGGDEFVMRDGLTQVQLGGSQEAEEPEDEDEDEKDDS